MDYIEVSVEITPFNEELAECITAELGDIGYESFVVEEPCLKAYIQKDNFAQMQLKCVMSGFDFWDGVKTSFSTKLILEQNWNAVWESGFEPIVINDMVTVKAPFHKMPLTKYNIVIEPKMAFGTGHHQTTTLMIRSLLALNKESDELFNANICSSDEISCDGVKTNEKSSQFLKAWGKLKGKQVLDMGTGTGVLAFLAAKMGAKREIHGIDVDYTAVNSAKENAYKNRLHRATHILLGDASLIQTAKYNLVLANINRNILLEDISTYSAGLKEGGILVVSGFYVEDIKILDKKAIECNFVKIKSLELEGWGAIIYLKK